MRNLAFLAVALLVALAGCAQNAQKAAHVEIHFLNVSQGDSELIVAGNRTMLVDCGQGEEGGKITEYLTKEDIYVIDYLVITHTDFDHIGGCAEILQKFHVKSVIMDGQQRDTLAYNKTMALIDSETLVIAKKYQEFGLDGAAAKVVHANTGSPDPNQNSIVLMLIDGNFKLLLDADCDLGCEYDLLKEDVDADVLKVAHHGSKYASSPEFLGKVSPRLAVISVGENNYGHPANETLARLKAAGAEILRTDLNGTIVLETDGSGYALVN